MKDTTGAVMPGLTDGDGNYKIVDLRPGAYVLTFSLHGSAP